MLSIVFISRVRRTICSNYRNSSGRLLGKAVFALLPSYDQGDNFPKGTFLEAGAVIVTGLGAASPPCPGCNKSLQSTVAAEARSGDKTTPKDFSWINGYSLVVVKRVISHKKSRSACVAGERGTARDSPRASDLGGTKLTSTEDGRSLEIREW